MGYGLSTRATVLRSARARRRATRPCLPPRTAIRISSPDATHRARGVARPAVARGFRLRRRQSLALRRVSDAHAASVAYTDTDAVELDDPGDDADRYPVAA